MSVAYVALGANLGEPEKQVRAALAALDQLPDVRVRARSPLYRTRPWGMLEQPPFINAVARLDTGLSALDLLHLLQKLEAAAGRVRTGQRWGPRLLDLDLLMVGQVCLDGPELQLPHPRMHERAFVMLPLSDIAPDMMVPGRGLVRELLESLDASDCERIEDFRSR